MDSTALFTFLYKTKPEVQSVELLGSWDSFSRPCRMQRDRHRGRGVWTGCHSFENIVCDGDRVDQSRPRNGALKQGGTYWYYYRLDDGEEACDSARPTTAACPLLPGQMVNVLDVPVEVLEAPQRVCSASADLPTTMEIPMTTNPEDRYKEIHRKPPTKLPRYYCSSDALRERFNAEGSRLSHDLSRPTIRPSSPGLRSAKRMRFEEPSYQRPGACQIDVTLEDMAMLANIPDTHQRTEELPVLRPFAPFPSSPVEERPVTRGGFLNEFTQGMRFPFFGSTQQATKNTHRFSEDFTMDFEFTPEQLPQYDGAFDEPHVIANTEWPLSPPMSDLADDESWPLPPTNRALNLSPVHGPSTPTSAIPILNLDDQLGVDAACPPSFSSPALSSSTRSDDYHPGFGPNGSSLGNDTFDIASPTFTAETMSSSPGVPTPDRFRLSINAPNTNTHDEDSEINESTFATGLEDLSRRLSALTSSESGYDDNDSDVESLFQVPKTDFYGFPAAPAPLYLRETEDEGSYETSNASCLTLKPMSRQNVLDTAEGMKTAFTISLPSTAGSLSAGQGIADEFSSDVLGALGIAI